MRTRTVPLILSLALLTTMAPVAVASHAGHTYEDRGSFDGTDRPAAYAVTAVREYAIHEVPEDAAISAELTWDDSPTVDMEVAIVPPAGTCQVLPAPEVFCLAESVPGHVENTSCDGATDPRGLDEDHREASVTTDRFGAWTVAVQATLLLPTDSVDYDVSFSVDESHGDMVAGDINYLQSNPHCFLVD